MEKKIKHRILGVLVVIGLVIILLPFLQSEKGITTETTALEAPPFPDQAVVASSTPQEIQETTEPTVPVVLQNSADSNEQQPDDTIRVVRPSVINEKMPDMTSNVPSTNVTGKMYEDDQLNIEDQKVIDRHDKKAIEIPAPAQTKEEVKSQLISEEELEELNAPLTKKSQKPVQAVREAAAEIGKVKPFVPKSKPFIPESYATNKKEEPASLSSLDSDGLAKLRDAAWVIQIGSFKNKTNALRLVNQLRANGYRAFIQQVSTSFGDSTRVFVGPERKHNAARALATQLESDLHIHGIVISYKPLAL